MNKHGFDSYDNIFRYFYAEITDNGIFGMIMRVAKYTRHYLFFSRLIKYAATVVAIIEASASLLIVATVFIIAVPVCLVCISLTAIFNYSRYKRYDPKIKHDIENSEKLIFIEARHPFFKRKAAYLNRMATTFRNEGYTVFVVSRSFFGDRFLAAKRVGRKLWVIKLNYYFHIKKHYLKGKEDISSYIY